MQKLKRMKNIRVPKPIKSLLVLILSNFLAKCALAYRYDYYVKNPNEYSILDAPVQNVNVYKDKGILPQAASFSTQQTKYFDSNHFKQNQKKSDKFTSKLPNHNYRRQVLLHHEYSKQHHYYVEPKLLKRVSRNKISTSEVKPFRDTDPLIINMSIADVPKGHLRAIYSNTSMSNSPTEFNIVNVDRSNDTLLSKIISNSSQQSDLSANQETISKVSLSSGDPFITSNNSRLGVNLIAKIPLMVQKMVSNNNSLTKMTEIFEKDMKYEISTIVSDSFDKSSTSASKFSHPTSSSNNPQESSFENVLEDSTLPTYDTTTENTKNSIEETNELPSPFNFFSNMTNIHPPNSVHNCKNNTNRLSNRIIQKINRPNTRKQSESQSEKVNNAGYHLREAFNSQDHNISDGESHSAKTKIELNHESPARDKLISYEDLPTNSFNNIDERLKVSKIMSTLELLMDIIDSKNLPKTNTKLQLQNMLTRISDIRTQFNTDATGDIFMANKLYNEFETPLAASIPPHLVPLGPNGAPLFNSIATQEKYKIRKLNITERFPFLTQITTTPRPTTSVVSNVRDHSTQSLIGRVLDRMTEDPDVRDGMMNGMLAVAPIAMLAIMSSVDLPALLLAPFAAVLPTFLFGSMGESNLSVSPSSGIQGSHNLNLNFGGMASDQTSTSEPQPPEIVSNDPLASEMAETLYPHLHSLIEFILG